MRSIRRLLTALILVSVFVTSIAFIYLNPTPVIITIGVFDFVELPVSFWIIGAFVLGGLLGLIFSFGWIRNIALQSKVVRLTNELKSIKR
ncbi:MAG: LapA family protein [Gammaproteobacteria bacterium]|nr:LapA family protein [Gammaproteobacteria bacterium]